MSDFAPEYWLERPALPALPASSPAAQSTQQLVLSGPLPSTQPPSLPREESTWKPLDLAPYLDGTRQRVEPSVGAQRTDGMTFLYPGKEHAVIGETESGKSWLCLACVLAELRKGRSVLYVHFEESDPSGTVERLLALGADKEDLRHRFHFVGPASRITPLGIVGLLVLQPSLVILDGVNEAMALHGNGIYDADGVASFRAALVKPFTAMGAAVLAADHVVKNAENRGRYAFGSVHKVNAVDGCVLSLENVRPFGRGKDGMSRIYVSKDRPGFLRAQGEMMSGGRTYIADLTVASHELFPLRLVLYKPQVSESSGEGRNKVLEESIVAVLRKLGGRADSFRAIRTALRADGKGARDTEIKKSLDDLLFAKQIEEVEAKQKGGAAYRLPAVLSEPA